MVDYIRRVGTSYLAVAGIVTSIVNIFKTNFDPTLSTRDKYKAYGSNYFNLILSLFGLKGAKAPSGLLPAVEEVPKPGIKDLFSKFWKSEPKAATGMQNWWQKII